MDNFLDFILKDIDAKKTIDSTAPTKTKTNRRQLYETLENIEGKYRDYQKNIRNYLMAKEKSLTIKDEDDELIHKRERIKNLEEVRALLNPSNTYFEKMGFDLLLYQINNYYVFNFNSLNKIINGFLEKFEQAGILLQSEDFDYTCYVHEYMTSFLEVYYKKSSNYNKVSEVFEQIYYLNPEIIGHIELNFRKLIEKNKHKFIHHISKLQKEAVDRNMVRDYDSCVSELKSLYNEVSFSKEKSISEIIELAKDGSIDIDQYLEDSKVRKTAFETVIADGIDYHNKEDMEDICTSLEKLEENIEEYNYYLEFLPLIKDFKDEYIKIVSDTTRSEYKGLREIRDTINKKEDELARINRKIFGGKTGFFDFKSGDPKTLKIESIYKAKELYELYKIYDQEYFKDKVMLILDKTLSIADLLNLYYSFDQFKKLEIQKVYNITDYNDIISYSERFDSFAKNPMNIIVTGISVFDEVPIQKIIVNKYRLNNINIVEGDLNPENVNVLLNKILLIIRVWKIEHGSTTIDKIWFMVNVDQLIKKERVKKG